MLRDLILKLDLYFSVPTDLMNNIHRPTKKMHPLKNAQNTHLKLKIMFSLIWNWIITENSSKECTN